MTDVSAFERRLKQALDRIAQHVEGQQGGAGTLAGMVQAVPSGDAARLQAELDKERSANAQLSDRVQQIKQRQETTIAQLERRLARLTEQLDLQSLEMLRLKKANARLMDANAALRDAQVAGVPESAVLNKSMAAELDALKAARRAEMAEMEEILAEIKPLLAAEQVAV